MLSHNAVQPSNGVYKLQALDRAFAVLDLLSSSSAPMGLAEIASALELHKSTAHRFHGAGAAPHRGAHDLR